MANPQIQENTNLFLIFLKHINFFFFIFVFVKNAQTFLFRMRSYAHTKPLFCFFNFLPFFIIFLYKRVSIKKYPIKKKSKVFFVWHDNLFDKSANNYIINETIIMFFFMIIFIWYFNNNCTTDRFRLWKPTNQALNLSVY